MKIVPLFLVASLLLVSRLSTAQEFTVPTDYQFSSKEDYARYEKDIINATNWLLATPLNEQLDKRKEVSAFVVKWINGSPTVNVELNPTIMDFDKKNNGMLVLFMASCAKFVLENNYSTDMRAKHRAALRDLIKVYKGGKGIEKDKKMEKLIKSDEEGKIDQWLADNLKIEGH